MRHIQSEWSMKVVGRRWGNFSECCNTGCYTSEVSASMGQKCTKRRTNEKLVALPLYVEVKVNTIYMLYAAMLCVHFTPCVQEPRATSACLFAHIWLMREASAGIAAQHRRTTLSWTRKWKWKKQLINMQVETFMRVITWFFALLLPLLSISPAI